MTQSREEKISTMVDASGKSDSRITSSERTFATFRQYAQSRGVDADSGTDIALPKTIAAWLGLIAGIGAEEGDQDKLATVRIIIVISL